MAGTKREVCRVVVQNREPALSEDVDEGKESLDQWQRSCERICLDLTVSPCLLTWSKAMLLQRPPPRTRYRRVFGSGSKLYQRFAVRGRFRHHSSDHVWLLFRLSLFGQRFLRKAQAEIDRVVGSDRLPALDDYENLPYIRCCIKESMRWMPHSPPWCASCCDQGGLLQWIQIPGRSYSHQQCVVCLFRCTSAVELST